MRYRWVALTVLLVLLLSPLCMFADGTLDFTILPLINSGTLAYSGGTNPLVGQNIQVSVVLGYGGTQNNYYPLIVTNGELDFSSGNSNGSWAWEGGSLTLTGTVGSFSGVLVQGFFSDASLQPQILGFDLNLGDFSGTTSSSLAAFYGFSSTSVQGSLEISTYIAAPVGSSFGGAPVLGGTVQTVDAIEAGGVVTTLCLLVLAGLCFALGIRLKALKLAM